MTFLFFVIFRLDREIQIVISTTPSASLEMTNKKGGSAQGNAGESVMPTSIQRNASMRHLNSPG